MLLIFYVAAKIMQSCGSRRKFIASSPHTSKTLSIYPERVGTLEHILSVESVHSRHVSVGADVDRFKLTLRARNVVCALVEIAVVRDKILRIFSAVDRPGYPFEKLAKRRDTTRWKR